MFEGVAIHVDLKKHATSALCDDISMEGNNVSMIQRLKKLEIIERTCDDGTVRKFKGRTTSSNVDNREKG